MTTAEELLPEAVQHAWCRAAPITVNIVHIKCTLAPQLTMHDIEHYTITHTIDDPNYDDLWH